MRGGWRRRRRNVVVEGEGGMSAKDAAVIDAVAAAVGAVKGIFVGRGVCCLCLLRRGLRDLGVALGGARWMGMPREEWVRV